MHSKFIKFLSLMIFLLIILILLDQYYSSEIQKYSEEINRLSNYNTSLLRELSEKTRIIEEKDDLIAQLEKSIEESPSAGVLDSTSVPVSLCSMSVDGGSEFKSYMDYRAVTDTSSVQYELLQGAVPDEYGLMTIDGYYCIATGSAYGELGDHLLVTLENGNQFYAIKSDEKSDLHTIDGKVDKVNSSVVEFIVDKYNLDPSVKVAGTVSVLDGFSSRVVNISKI